MENYAIQLYNSNGCVNTNLEYWCHGGPFHYELVVQGRVRLSG